MSLSYAELEPYLKRYGRGCLAYSGLQEGMEYYLEPEVGFVSYYSFRHWLFAPFGRKIVLGDPVCAAEQAEGLLKRFIEKFKRVVLLQCTPAIGQVMENLGYEVNMWGQECELPMPFNLAGKHRAKLRQWSNKCRREGVEVEERAISACDMAEIDALSAAWIQEKGGKELALATRPFVKADEPDVRCFWARQDGKLVGLAIFDPLYQDDKIVGYYHNFDRLTANAPNGTSAYIILEAMQCMEQDGVEFVSLGLMPLWVIRKHFRQNDFTMRSLQYSFSRFNFLYPFQGNVSHKKKFHGRQFPVYISSTQGNGLREVFILMKAMRMI